MEQIYMMKISEISYNARNFITIGHWKDEATFLE